MGSIEELVNAGPDSIRLISDDGSIYSTLVRSTIKYLLLLPEIRLAAYTLNRSGFTALDVLERCPRDSISVKIEDVLIEAGAQRSSNMDDNAQQPAPSPGTASQEEPNQSSRGKRWEKLWSRYLYKQDNWMKENMQGTLMMVATVIATMTFQSTISPPGGVWQENTTNSGLKFCNTHGFCEAGCSVLAYSWQHDFLKLMTFNTASFFSSLFVVLLVTSGLPLTNKVMMWVLTIAMIVTVTFKALTYIYALGLITPSHLSQNIYEIGIPLAVAWGIMLLIVGLLHTLRLFFSLKKRKMKKLPD
ncbi:ankyrin repeat protein [Spatholobus suberectus]|nr:ankyrin repeat protein [Spatholobus suberectus]